MNLRLFLLLIFFSFCSIVKSQLTIRVVSVPPTTLPEDKIFIAGTMNNWNPGLSNYELIKSSDGIYSITFTPLPGTVKFKFTRGSWDKVEGSALGTFIADRSTTYSGAPKTLDLTIAGWEGINITPSTASAQVKVLSDTFYIPQLNRRRRIWLYLPKDYQNSNLSYPVLYMHDGQNLFDKKTSFSGEWGIDEALDSMYLKGDKGCIVVGIENGGAERLNEYSPWINSQYGGGQGDEYIDFIANTLKPYIDKHFRTLSDADNTGIMGSSMGGLISMYAGIEYPNIFGKIGAFSSSFWFSSDSYKQVTTDGVKPVSYIYLIAGAKEGGNQVGDLEKMYQTLLNAGAHNDQLLKLIHTDGQHSEWYWKREFPQAFKWLFEKKTSETSYPEFNDLKVYFSGGRFYFSGADILSGDHVTVYDIIGNLVLKDTMDDNLSIDGNRFDFRNAIYIIKVGNTSIKFLLK